MNNVKFFTDLLPDLIHTIESLMGTGNGEAKMTAVLSLVEQAMNNAKVNSMIVQITLALAKLLIPMFVKKFNLDPNNTVFTKPVS